jgi:hypothetical protein
MPKVSLSENQYCHATGKRRFPNEQDATQRARIAERGDPKHVPRRVYRCDKCSDWHMTTYTEYQPDQPQWMLDWRNAARGKTVTTKEPPGTPPLP